MEKFKRVLYFLGDLLPRVFFWFAVLAVVLAFFTKASYTAESVNGRGQWSKYESGTNNVRLDGYQNQHGYIAFTDGNGNIEGYMYWDTGGNCVAYVTDEGIDLSTTQITEGSGVCIDTD